MKHLVDRYFQFCKSSLFQRFTFFGFILFLFGISLFAEKIKFEEQDSDQEIIVAVAANFKSPMEEIQRMFQKQYPNSKIMYLYGASGHLTNQIRNGAPIDLFLSADLDFPTTLYQEGYSENPPEVYAEGILILVGNETLGSETPIPTILESKQTKHIAIANPKTAPYGRAAVEYLQKVGVWKSIQDKLVYGESVTQVNQFVLAGASDIGFTSYSAVKSNENLWKYWKKIDPEFISPILQGKILIKSKSLNQSGKRKMVQNLYQFINSNYTDSIFKKYGYGIPNLNAKSK